MVRAALFPAGLVGVAMAGAMAAAELRCVTDDAGREVCLDAPAQRIISLSPGVTELLFAAGAGERLRGAVRYSDYPEAAKDIPRVGSHTRVDMETLLAKEPDLVVAWTSGNPEEQLERIEALGLTVYYSEPRRFDDVAHTVERLGRLAGTEAVADATVAEFRAVIDELTSRYAEADPVRVFYQVWDDPIMTVNDTHLISQAIMLCGGENVFGDVDRLVPRLDRESVLAAEPEAIVAGGMGEEDTSWLEGWEPFDGMTAVQRGNLFFVPPSSIQRPTPRVAEGARLLCEHLETARERR